MTTASLIPRLRLLLLLLLLATAAPVAAADDDGDAGWDVYLLIGQSNMAGRGPLEASDTAEVIPGVWLLNAEGKPEPAVAPLNRYSTVRKDLPLQEVGPGVSFGAEMHRRTGRRILIVQNARGGSGIRSWQPGDRAGYLDSALVRTRQALRYGPLRGICWHQGETDTPRRDPARYATLFDTLAAALRTALGDVPIVVGEVGRWEWADADDIALFNDSTLAEACRRVPRVGKVSSLGLGPRWPEKPKDPHFSRAAALELGRRYAEAMMRLY